ncbi:MAG: hypothetical protein ACOYME_14435 [Prochlorotrichaceae cyanobacterium]
MKLYQLILAFIATICMIFAGNALAQTDININDGNLIRFGGSIIVAENQTVENAIAFGGSVTVSPNAKVVDTAIAFGGDVILKKGAEVEGDVYSFGGTIVQEPGAIVSGEKATFGDRNGSDQGRNFFFIHYFLSVVFRIGSTVVAAILGLIILDTRPQFLPQLATKLYQQPGLTALWGIVAHSALFFGIIFLAITLIGIPLIPLLILIAIVTCIVGSLGVALFVGQCLLSKSDRPLQQQFLVGLVILTVLTLIPFFGGLVVFLINLFGVGVILLWKFGKERPQIAIESR